MDCPSRPPDAALARLLDSIWHLLTSATRDRRAGWRHPMLATVDATGAPRVRTLVLRTADRAGPVLTLHTDGRSAKAAEIAREPRVALAFWDPANRLQLRVEGRAALCEDAKAFAALPPETAMVYAVAPRPGAPIASPEAVERGDAAGAFRVLSVVPARFDWLDLAGAHRRARFDLVAGQAGWLVP